jgi:membrane-associated protein
MLAVLGGAAVVALGVWTIRRRHGGGVIEPAKK